MRLLSDENFNGNIVRGLFLRQPSLDLLRVQDVNLLNVDDPEILEWSANNNRILLTHVSRSPECSSQSDVFNACATDFIAGFAAKSRS
jgi:hypothetical protein